MPTAARCLNPRRDGPSTRRWASLSREVGALAVTLATVAPGCAKTPSSADVTPSIAAAADEAGALEIYAELEALIGEGKDSEDDRVYALDRVKQIEDDSTAEYAFVRAALSGRVAELRGVKAGKLVTEVEHYARLSIERDPQFRDKAATRMLGSLYVMAPPRLVEHGDSEEGLELLEDLTDEQPSVVINHVRLAEAFIHLGDPDPALSHLCTAAVGRGELRADQAALLDRLLADVGGLQSLQCDAGAAEA